MARIFGSQPDRGDVVVFRLPKDDSTDYIKRVIGLPGDRIQMINGLLHINGEPVKRERIEDYHRDRRSDRAIRVKRWRETLPNGVSYTTLDLQDNGFYDNTQEYVVPAGHYFMMGDNRDNSTDSRVLESGRLCAVQPSDRPGSDHLLLGSARATGHGRSGCGRGPCAGTVFSRSCDEPARRTMLRPRSPARTPCAAGAAKQKVDSLG